MTTTATSINSKASVPSGLSTLVQAGTNALNDGDLRLALDKFEEVVNAFPDRPEGHNNLGALYSSIGDFEKAEECFSQVIEILPDNPNILYNRGVVRSRLEKFDGARQDFQAVLAINPTDADTLNNLGVAAYMQGHMEEGREYFTQAMVQRPDYENALMNRIDLEITTSNHATAVALCEEFLTTNTSLEVRRKHLDLLSSGCRDALDQAAAAAESLLIAEKENTEIQAELGRLTRARSSWTEATANF